MALNDQIYALILTSAINYGIIYRKNKFFGNVVFMLIGIATANYASTDATMVVSGVLIFFMGLISLIFDILARMYPQKEK